VQGRHNGKLRKMMLIIEQL